jgi:hypothetical protein
MRHAQLINLSLIGLISAFVNICHFFLIYIIGLEFTNGEFRAEPILKKSVEYMTIIEPQLYAMSRITLSLVYLRALHGFLFFVNFVFPLIFSSIDLLFFEIFAILISITFIFTISLWSHFIKRCAKIE